jgi:hypothetical protein
MGATQKRCGVVGKLPFIGILMAQKVAMDKAKCESIDDRSSEAYR